MNLVGGGGIGFLILVFALKWLDRDRGEILRVLGVEREARIALLEQASKTCAEDRAQMRQKIDKLEEEVRGLLKQMVKVAASGKCGAECLSSEPGS